MSASTRQDVTRGIWAALASFTLWGVAPLYWHLLKHVPSLQIVLHRVVWSALLVGAFLTWRDGRHWLRLALTGAPRLRAMLLLSSVLIAFNWGLYIWAVNAGHVVETALGYFINPLLNVVIGVLFLRERLRPLQWLSVAIALVGVLWLTWQYGRPPWIALALAASFGLYGVLRKLAHVDAVTGLGIENAYLVLPALAALLWLHGAGLGYTSTGPGDTATFALLVLSGLITALPLIGFAYAVRRVSLTVVGVMQYIAPTLQFLIGVLIFDEPFDRVRLLGFLCIWVALAVFMADGLRHTRRQRQAALADLA
ncbi:EamA family transporter RarD [Thermomonas sp. S9]|uniref:Chloramphenicol-sensitive protein RarD n=1 Tax=Thermomonas hydrothermalis TaxID=213588 RepID=A0A1M5AP67_9GAMM|nr:MULTISPECIES: EamA family transporter RarD [Thermomonas]MCR6494989.1 EamA family transporter RarD [Thermomonas sp. S9]SHF31956.1 chloramphenicol-sensitive protein RarD [Thermomonas hydrothermalis]